MIRDLVVTFFLLSGGAFMLLAALGVARMPDLFSRMQAATKAGSISSGLLLLAVAVQFATAEITLRAMAVVVFYFLTAPVASHMIARAAYLIGVPLWHGTRLDELREHVNQSRMYSDRTSVRKPDSPGTILE